MYYVNKIVTWVMSPMGMLFIGLGVGALMRRRGREKGGGSRWRWTVAGRILIGLTLALTWVLGCGVTTRLIGVPLEGEESKCEVEGVDAIVLLGGGMGAHAKCGRAEMFSGADRVWTAARLWKEMVELGGRRRLPIFCSGRGAEASTTPLLRDLGVDERAIRYFDDARNTEEEARLIKEELTHHCPPPPLLSTSARPKVLLVTSAWHMPRAKMLFERAGLEVTPAPTDYEMHYAAEAPLTFGDFFPGAEALVRNSCAVKEWVARFCYWLKG